VVLVAESLEGGPVNDRVDAFSQVFGMAQGGSRRGGREKSMDLTETEALRVWCRSVHVCQVAKIEWYSKQPGEVRVILADLL